MMSAIKNLLRVLMGLNAASVVRGLRLGFPESINGSFASYHATHPLQDRSDNQIQKEWRSIPEVNLGEILGARKAAIKLNVQKYEDGMLPSGEVMALLSILVVENPREALEIGTFMGHTTKAMAENLPDSIIHTVDLPLDFSEQQNSKNGPPKDDFHLIARRVVGREFKGQVEEQQIRQHFGDTAAINFQNFGKPTFFFIDGSHTYEYCKQDSEKCFTLCGGHGTFLWHDCNHGHPGVIRFILEWRGMGRNITRIQGTSIGYWKNT
jgi:hypothetical protein